MELLTEDDAQATAREVVADSLRTSAALPLVAKLKLDALRRRASVESQLKQMVTAQLNDAQAARDCLQTSMVAIEDLREQFRTVDEMSRECRGLIPGYETVKVVASARANVLATRNLLREILDIPAQVEVLTRDIEEEGNLLAVHANLCRLDLARSKCLKSATASSSARDKLQIRFAVVDEIFEKLYARMWDILSNVLTLAEERPASVVQVMRIIERDEKLDPQRLINGEKPEPAVAFKGVNNYGETMGWFGQNAEKTLRKAIRKRFDSVLAETSNPTELVQALGFVDNDLTTVLDDVAPLFPPRYDVFAFYVQAYHDELYKRLETVAKDPTLSPKEILLLITWADDYPAELAGLGVSPPPQPDIGKTFEPLVAVYQSMVKSRMQEWATKICSQNANDTPEVEDGLLQTPAPVQLFRMIDEQFEVARVAGRSEFIFEIAKTCLGALQFYTEMLNGDSYEGCIQAMTRIALSIDTSTEEGSDLRGDKLGYLIAQVNDNYKSMSHLDDFNDNVSAALNAEYSVRYESTPMRDATSQCFFNTAKAAMDGVVDVIFKDVEPDFNKLFRDEWYDDDVVEELTETLDFHLSTIKDVMCPSFFRKLATQCLERTVLTYLRKLFKAPRLHDDGNRRLDADVSMISDTFEEHVTKNALERTVSVLANIVVLVNWEICDIESIALYLDSLLDSTPDITNDEVMTLLSLRPDVNREEKKYAKAELISAREAKDAARQGGDRTVSLLSRM